MLKQRLIKALERTRERKDSNDRQIQFQDPYKPTYVTAQQSIVSRLHASPSEFDGVKAKTQRQQHRVKATRV